MNARWLVLAALSVSGCSCNEGSTLERNLPQIEVAPTALDFGAGRPGEAIRRTLQVRSVGQVALELVTARVIDDTTDAFRVLRFAPGAVAAGAEVTIELSAVAFDRSGAAKLEITSNAENTPVLLVPLSVALQAEDAGVVPDAAPVLADAGVLDDDAAAAPDALVLDDAATPPPPADAGPSPDASLVACPAAAPIAAQGFNPRVAWNGARYGFVYRRTVAVQHVMFQLMDPSGALLALPGEVDLQSEAFHSQENAIAASPTQFGVIWSTQTGLYAQIVDAQGAMVRPTHMIRGPGYGGAIAHNSDDDEFAVVSNGDFARIGNNGARIGPNVGFGGFGTHEIVYNTTDHRYVLTEYDFNNSRLDLRFLSNAGSSFGTTTVWTASVGVMLDTNAGNYSLPLAWNSVDNEYGVVVRRILPGQNATDPAAYEFIRVDRRGSVVSTRTLLPTQPRGQKDPHLGWDGQHYLVTFHLPALAVIRVMQLDRDGVPLSVADCDAPGTVYYPNVGLGPAPHPLFWNQAPDVIMGTAFTP